MFDFCSGGKETPKKGLLDPLHPLDTIGRALKFDEHQSKFPPEDGKESVLIEIVGALGLEAVRGSKGGALGLASAALSDTDVDPYCIVKVGTKQAINDDDEQPTMKIKKPKEIHRTKKINDDSSPIWTVKTGSLCLAMLEPGQTIIVELWCVWKLKHHLVGTVELDLLTLLMGDGSRTKHTLLFEQEDVEEEESSEDADAIVQETEKKKEEEGEEAGNGIDDIQEEKKEELEPAGEPKTKKQKLIPISLPLLRRRKKDAGDKKKKIKTSRISLALRYRPATIEDYNFVNEIPDNTTTETSSSLQANDHDFKNVGDKGILTRKSKTVTTTTTTDVTARSAASDGSEVVKTKTKLYRVWPCPDPDRPEETKYLSKEDIYKEAEKPSTQWIEAGSGEYGTVFLEVLSCDKLPNMDTELVTGLTDAFCGIVFEDVYVRTSVIHDSLNPRWMPWSTRAFMFNVAHPTSILMLGVFDFDEGPLKNDDPIGRVVLHLDEFEAGTMYTLSYPLYHGDTQSEEHRGSIKLRFRIERNAGSRVPAAPPRFMINTKSEGPWRTLRYITRGSVDMTDVTIASVKLYANEVLDYWKKYCYLFDVAAGILLWRGRANVSLLGKDFSIWFPIHSVVLFALVFVGLEFPVFLPSVFFYVLAYCLLCVNYYACNHPSPWRRVRPFLFSLGSSGRTIEPGTGIEGTETRFRLDTYKANRVTCFLYQFMKTGLNVYRVYSKNTPVDISTVSSSGGMLSSMYRDYLYYAHVMLKMLCRYTRLLRNFVNWKVPATHKLTATLLLWATVWCFFPYKGEAFFAFRIMTYLCLGPWIKLVDMLWIHKYYRTTEDILRDGIPETLEEMQADIMSRPNIMEPLLNSKLVESWSQMGRIVQEDNLKLKDVREKRYGKWSEAVPPYDASRFPSVPFEETSYAQPYAKSPESAREGDYVDLPLKSLKVHYIAGQKLDGDMIPQPTIQPINKAKSE